MFLVNLEIFQWYKIESLQFNIKKYVYYLLKT